MLNMFRRLLKHRFLHYHPKKATKIINTCTVLHNMCISNNVPLPTGEDLFEVDMGILEPNFSNEAQRQENDLVQGRHGRSTVINYLFRNRQI